MRRLLVVAAALAALAPGAGAAGAATCTPTAKQVFLSFGDTGQYFLAPGGSFESASWTLAGGAKLVAGNESYNVGGKGKYALALPAGSSATSPTFCVTPTDASLRFFLRNTADPSSKLAVDVLYTTSKGTTGSLQVASLTGTSTWQPSPITYYYANLLALVSPDGTTSVAIRLRPLDALGSWTVDDVFVDPFKR